MHSASPASALSALCRTLAVGCQRLAWLGAAALAVCLAHPSLEAARDVRPDAPPSSDGLIESIVVLKDGRSLRLTFTEPVALGGDGDLVEVRAKSGVTLGAFAPIHPERRDRIHDFAMIDPGPHDVVWREHDGLTATMQLSIARLTSTGSPILDGAEAPVANRSARALGMVRVMAPRSRAAQNGVGSPVDPWGPDEAQRGVRSGMTIRLRGGIYRERLDGWPLGLSNVTIESEDPENPAFLRGDRVLGRGAWLDLGGGVYAAKAPERALSVIWNWDTNLTEETPPRQPRHYGHLRPVSSAQAVAGRPGSWFHDAQTGWLYVRPPRGGLPPTEGDAYAYCVAGNALQIEEWTNSTIRHLKTALYVRADGAQEGYAVRGVSCRGCTVEHVEAWDHGRHTVGFPGDVSVRNTIRNVTAHGGHSTGTVNQQPFVFAGLRPYGFREDPTQSDNLGEDLTWHAYPLLGPSGRPVDGHMDDISRDYRGAMLNSHAAGRTLLQGVRWVRPTLYSYAIQDGLAYQTQLLIGSNEEEFPFRPKSQADELDPEAYPIQVYDAIVDSVRADVAPVPGAAFVRCRFTMRSNEARRGLAGTHYQTHNNRRQTLYLACTFQDEGFDGDVELLGWHRVQDRNRVIFALCTMRQQSEDMAFAWTWVTKESVFGPKVKYLQCVLAYKSPDADGRQRQVRSFGVGSTPHLYDDFVANWFVNHDPENVVKGDVEHADEADFKSRMAPEEMGNVYHREPGFREAAAGDLAPAPMGPLDRTTWFVPALEGVRGVNGGWYDGHYGAYQMGCRADLTGDGVVDSADLGRMLQRWGVDPTGRAFADLNDDGGVDAADLVQLLVQWGPCR